MELDEEYEQFLTIQWSNDHLLIVVGDSLLFLSWPFLVFAFLFMAACLTFVAVRLWLQSA